MFGPRLGNPHSGFDVSDKNIMHKAQAVFGLDYLPCTTWCHVIFSKTWTTTKSKGNPSAFRDGAQSIMSEQLGWGNPQT